MALAPRVSGRRCQAVVIGDLAERYGAVTVGQRAQARQEFQVFRPRLVVNVLLPEVGIGASLQAELQDHSGVLGRIIAQLGVVRIEIGGVQAKAVDAVVEPEFHLPQ